MSGGGGRGALLLCGLITLGSPGSAVAVMRTAEIWVNARDVRAICVIGETAWLATTGGLLRRRAGKHRLFTVRDGLPPGPLHALLAQPDGTLWVGGDRGLARLRVDGEGVTVLQRVPARGVRALARYREALYLGSWGGGLRRLAAETGRAYRVRAARSALLDRVTALAVAPDGLYLATAGAGVARLDRRNRLRRVRGSRLPSPLVWSLAVDGQRVWAATSGGLAVLRRGRLSYDRRLRIARGLPVRDLRLVAIDRRAVLVGSYGGGMHRIGRTLEPLLVGRRVWAVARDAKGLLLGAGQGLWVERDGRLAHEPIDGPVSNDISALVEGHGGIWIGTFDAGLSHLRQGHWRHFGRRPGLPDDRINHLAVQRLGRGEVLWIATPRGVSRFAEGRFSWFAARDHLVPGHVNGIHVDGQRVYFASSGGLTIFDGRRWRRLAAGRELPLRQTTAVTVDRARTLWVAGIDGLARRMADGSWRRLEHASGQLPDDWVTALHADQRGLWVGTYDGGVAHLGARTRIWREGGRAGTLQRLPCGWVNPHAMARDRRGTLWVGTMERGLLFHRRRGGWGQLGRGLPSRDVTAVQPASDGGLWVATRGGLARLVSAQEEGLR